MQVNAAGKSQAADEADDTTELGRIDKDDNALGSISSQAKSRITFLATASAAASAIQSSISS